MRLARLCSFVVLASACTSAERPDASATVVEAAPAEPPAQDPATASATSPDLRVVAVAAGGRTSYALMSDGTVRAWGDGGKGELGSAEPSYVATPVEVPGITGATAIAAGGREEATACAIVDDGTVRCWGYARGFPVPTDSGAQSMPVTEIESLAGAKELSVGHGYGCAILADDLLYCWGDIPGWSEVRTREHRGPVVVLGLPDAAKVRSGLAHACALTKEGIVECWGRNDASQVSPFYAPSKTIVHPWALDGITNVIDIGVARHFTCALLADRSVHCWGESTEDSSTAKFPAGYVHEVETSVPTAAFSTGASGRHLCLLDERGHARCLGSNDRGQLGTDAASQRSTSTPLDVPGVTGIVSLATADAHTCAATDDGRVWCWGENRFGGLGDGTLADHAIPQPVAHVTAPVLPAPTRPVAPEEGAVQDFSSLPEGCTHGSLALAAEITPKTSFEVKTTTASVDDDGKTLWVHLRDHAFDPKRSWLERPRGDQLMLTITFTRLAVSYRRSRQPWHGPGEPERVERSLKVVPGVYKTRLGWIEVEPSPKVEPTVTVHLGDERVVREIESAWDDHDAAQQVELTYLGRDWVCGTISLAGEKGSLSGPFAAKVRE